MRGDRPDDPEGVYEKLKFTPHARGSTNETIYDALEYLVYPACAGIDLQSTAYEAWVLCLPRMRGDRPGIYPCFFPVIPFTPHARGSTLKEGMMVRVLPVYPACAGIDLM